jgi:hypothetical protein
MFLKDATIRRKTVGTILMPVTKHIPPRLNILKGPSPSILKIYLSNKFIIPAFGPKRNIHAIACNMPGITMGINMRTYITFLKGMFVLSTNQAKMILMLRPILREPMAKIIVFSKVS